MLTQLTIQNFGLIDRLELEFCAGLNILTGATGAGKSIILDGLRFVLGERLQSAQIRDPQQTCLVEAVFTLTAEPWASREDFQEYLDPADPTLIISRQQSADGRAKIRVNGHSVTVTQLRALGDQLIDFHGAHDHQQLLSEHQHRPILDQLADFGPAKDQFVERYREYQHLQSQLADLQAMTQTRDRDLDMLTHQIQELTQVPLEDAALDQLKEKILRVNNAERLFEGASELLTILEGPDSGISEWLDKACRPMRSLNQVDTKTAGLAETLETMQTLNQELLRGIRDYLEELSFEPQEAAALNDRYDIYLDILRKYGPGLAQARDRLAEAQQRHALLIDLHHNDQDLRARIETAAKDLTRLARTLTKVRKATAETLRQTIEQELQDLGIAHVRFEVRITPTDFHAHGADQVVFFISPNAGEDLKPLAEIVSSGEAARLMLALKRALTKVDPVPVLIFDEIDAQIGGRLGTITGTKLKQLSADRQVLLITHLPQIASFADRHFKVTKTVTAGRTVLDVQALDEASRIDELAHMLSGKLKDNLARQHAQALFSEAQAVTI